MMKKYIFLIMIVLSGSLLSAQVYPAGLFDHDTIRPAERSSFSADKKLRFSLEMGTSIGLTGSKNSYLSSFVSPRLTYPLSNRLLVSTGVKVFRATGDLLYNPFENQFNQGEFSGSLLYVEGAYHVNPSLTLRGATFQEVSFRNEYPQWNQGFNSGENYKGFMMGVDYKLGDNVFIRGEVEFSNGRNPYLYSPYFFPAGNSRFDRGF